MAPKKKRKATRLAPTFVQPTFPKAMPPVRQNAMGFGHAQERLHLMLPLPEHLKHHEAEKKANLSHYRKLHDENKNAFMQSLGLRNVNIANDQSPSKKKRVTETPIQHIDEMFSHDRATFREARKSKDFSLFSYSRSTLQKELTKNKFKHPLPITSEKSVLYHYYAFQNILTEAEASKLALELDSRISTKLLWPSTSFRDEVLNRPSVIPPSKVIYQSREWLDKLPKAREKIRKEKEKMLLLEKARMEKIKYFRRQVKQYTAKECLEIFPQLRERTVVKVNKMIIDKCPSCSRDIYIIEGEKVHGCSCPLVKVKQSNQPTTKPIEVICL